MKDKRSEFRCHGCINNTIPIDAECPHIAYRCLCETSQLVDYGSCYKSSDKRFFVANSCKLCTFYEAFNCASGFCRHPSFKLKYIDEGYKGKKLVKWNSLYIQFPERIHIKCPLPKLESV